MKEMLNVSKHLMLTIICYNFLLTRALQDIVFYLGNHVNKESGVLCLTTELPYQGWIVYTKTDVKMVLSIFSRVNIGSSFDLWRQSEGNLYDHFHLMFRRNLSAF